MRFILSGYESFESNQIQSLHPRPCNDPRLAGQARSLSGTIAVGLLSGVFISSAQAMGGGLVHVTPRTDNRLEKTCGLERPDMISG